MAPRVVDLELQPVTQALLGGYLKTVVIAIGPCAELRDRAETRIRRRAVGKRREASCTNRLVSVDLCRMGLIYRARTHILRLEIGAGAKLMLDRQTPLHKVRRTQLPAWYGGDRNRRQASSR